MNRNTLRAASNQAYAFMARNPILTLIAAAVILYAVLLLLPAFFVGIRDGFSDREVEKTKEAAAAEKTSAEQERMSAGEFEVERKTEDRYREEKLKPERERLDQSLAASKARRQKLEEEYAKTRLNGRNPDLDDLNLRRRNCADLAELYPKQRFAGCQ